jgi:hypothetical protein
VGDGAVRVSSSVIDAMVILDSKGQPDVEFETKPCVSSYPFANLCGLESKPRRP